MTAWKQVPFEGKIATHVVVVVAIILSVFYLFHKSNAYFIDSTNAVEHTNEVLLKNKNVLIQAQDLQNGMRGYLLSAQEEDEQLFTSAASRIKLTVLELKELTGDNPIQQVRIRLIDTLVSNEVAFAGKVIETRSRQGYSAAFDLYSTGIGRRLINQLRVIVAQIEAEEKRLMVLRKDATKKSIDLINSRIGLFIGTVLLLLAVLFIIIYRNIVKRNKAEAQLQRLLNGVQRVMDASDDVICVIDEEGRLRHLSATCERLFGFSENELIGKKYIELVHADDRAKTNKVADEIMAGAAVADFENRYCRKDGKFIAVAWSAIWSKEDQQMYCIARDPSEKKETLAQLKKSQERLSHAQKIARLGSWEIDLRQQRISCSEEVFTILGRAKEEMGCDLESFYQIMHPEDVSGVRAAIERSLKRLVDLDTECRILKPDGEVVYIHARGEMVVDKQIRGILFQGTLQDITSHKKLEEERERVIDALTKTNADLKQFSFITSHNFRAPLSNIIAILKLIEYGQLNQYTRELVEMLALCTQQLQQTIDDLTKVLFIKSAGDVEIKALRFSTVIEKVENILGTALKEAGGEIKKDLEVPSVQFNQVYLEAIISNLVSNAIKFRETNRQLQIEIKTKKGEEGKTVLIVKDNGIGIDLKRQKDKLFGLYQRFDVSVQGRGTGLFIIKSQIEALGGTIAVESNLGEGTTFIVTFPTLSITPTENQV
jgi:PAS domain S-box-containing protein